MTRLTDAELDALLADLDTLRDATGLPLYVEWNADAFKHGIFCEECSECGLSDEDAELVAALHNAWPKLRRLATEVRDLRAVLETVRTWRNAADEIKRFDAEKVNAVAQTVLRVREALARYEEGGR